MYSTPRQFLEDRQEMGLTQEQMAFLLRSPVSDVQGWEDGIIPIPGPVYIAVFLLRHCCDLFPHEDGTCGYNNRYLRIAEEHGYKVPPGHDGPLPPEYRT